MRCAIRDLELEASCLSWVRRESHAQFFGQEVVVIPPPYPTTSRGSAAEPTTRKGHSIRRVIWGVTPAHLNPSEGGRLLLATRPKFSTCNIHFWAIMLKNFHIRSPNGR